MTTDIHITAKAQLAVFIFPFLFLFFALLIYFYSPTIYSRLFGILERGLFEWVQFLCYGLSSFLGVKAYIACKRDSQKPIQTHILFLFAIGCAFIALEEISYGQHIFKWEASEAIKKINLQNETNLHNLAVIQGNNIQVKAFILIGWFGSLAWIFRRRPSESSITDLVMPEWYLSSYFLPVAIFYTQLLWIFHWGNDHQETFETILSFGFLGIALINLMKLRSGIKPSRRCV